MYTRKPQSLSGNDAVEDGESFLTTVLFAVISIVVSTVTCHLLLLQPDLKCLWPARPVAGHLWPAVRNDVSYRFRLYIFSFFFFFGSLLTLLLAIRSGSIIIDHIGNSTKQQQYRKERVYKHEVLGTRKNIRKKPLQFSHLRTSDRFCVLKTNLESY